MSATARGAGEDASDESSPPLRLQMAGRGNAIVGWCRDNRERWWPW